MIRVLLIDQHRIFRWGLRKLIDEEAPRMSVVGEATCREEALGGLRNHPDIVLLDPDLGQENGLEVLAQLRDRSAAKVIVFTALHDAVICSQALMLGASGFLHKLEPAEVVLNAITRVHGGELWPPPIPAGRVPPSLSANGQRQKASPPPAGSPLTDTQRRVIAAVVKHRGAPAKVIAEAMHISPYTLRNHLALIYDRLGMHRRIDLVLYAMEVGLDKQ